MKGEACLSFVVQLLNFAHSKMTSGCLFFLMYFSGSQFLLTNISQLSVGVFECEPFLSSHVEWVWLRGMKDLFHMASCDLQREAEKQQWWYVRWENQGRWEKCMACLDRERNASARQCTFLCCTSLIEAWGAERVMLCSEIDIKSSKLICGMCLLHV